MKQKAYAMRIWGAQGSSKKEIALDVGYSLASARSTVQKIESKPGFQNAIMELALKSNNLALAAMAEFNARGFKDFSNKDLVGALNAIGQAWSKFNTESKNDMRDEDRFKKSNRLRTVILSKSTNIYPNIVDAEANPINPINPIQTEVPQTPAPPEEEIIEEVIQPDEEVEF